MQDARKELERLHDRLKDLYREISEAYDNLPREAGVTRLLVVNAGSAVNMAATDMWTAMQSLEEDAEQSGGEA